MSFEVLNSVLTLNNISWIAFGVLLGYVVGVIPGLGKGTAVAVSIPITFYLSPLTGIAYLIGIAKGSTAGSAVSAILLNTPGEPSSAPTALDGYPMSQKGQASKALKMGLFASVIGDFFATLLLIFLAAPLAEYALLFGPVEVTSILLFSLTFIAALSGDSLIKGLIAGLFGLLFSTVGMEIETATVRFTFGILELFDGLSLIPVAIGMLAVAEMLVQLGGLEALEQQQKKLKDNIKTINQNISWQEWKLCFPAIFRGTLVGSTVGILPGLGASVASFLSYGLAKKAAKDPSRFGKGAIEGIAAAESADNAVVPSSLVPLFALGIPGSVIAAILIGAFIIQGVTPGPLMFVQQPQLVNGIYLSMICASLLLLVIGFFGQKIFSMLSLVSLRLIIPSVIFFCAIGSYLQGGGIIGVWLILFFGIFGYFAKKLDFSFVTFLIGFVVGPQFELSLRQAIAVTPNFENLLNHPIAIIFTLLTILAMWKIGAAKKKIQ
jgi:putative tricarboxylic transport membrane protein